MIDRAIGLTPENESAWSYKANFTLELEKLAKMARDARKRVLFHDEDELALRQTTNLGEKSRQEKSNDSRVRSKP